MYELGFFRRPGLFVWDTKRLAALETGRYHGDSAWPPAADAAPPDENLDLKGLTFVWSSILLTELNNASDQVYEQYYETINMDARGGYLARRSRDLGNAGGLSPCPPVSPLYTGFHP